MSGSAEYQGNRQGESDWLIAISGAVKLQMCSANGRNLWHLVIGLVRDYVTCSKFTTKPRLCDISSNFRCPRVVFTWVFFSS